MKVIGLNAILPTRNDNLIIPLFWSSLPTDAPVSEGLNSLVNGIIWGSIVETNSDLFSTSRDTMEIPDPVSTITFT
jgi:hypothetical protein